VCPLHRRTRVTASIAQVAERPRCIHHPSAQLVAHRVDPALQLVRCAAHEEPFEKVAVVERQRLLELSMIEQLGEHAHVARDGVRRDAHFFGAAAHEHTVTELVTQEVQRLPQRLSRLHLIQIRPEQCEQMVAPLESACGFDGEMAQQRQSLRLRQHRAQLFAIRAAQRERAQRIEPDHHETSVRDSTLPVVTEAGK
jgi:hypothetical protein